MMSPGPVHQSYSVPRAYIFLWHRNGDRFI